MDFREPEGVASQPTTSDRAVQRRAFLARSVLLTGAAIGRLW